MRERLHHRGLHQRALVQRALHQRALHQRLAIHRWRLQYWCKRTRQRLVLYLDLQFQRHGFVRR